jgi:hypothetical protein
VDLLQTALQLVLRDHRSTNGIALRLLDEPSSNDPEYESMVLLSSSRSRTGLLAPLDMEQPERVIHVADQVQEFVHEELNWLGLPVVWPECPEHPASHPLRPVLVVDKPSWQCPRSGHTISAIGEL